MIHPKSENWWFSHLGVGHYFFNVRRGRERERERERVKKTEQGILFPGIPDPDGNRFYLGFSPRSSF